MSGQKFDTLPEIVSPSGEEKLCVVDEAGDLKNMKLSTVLGQVPAPPTIPTNVGKFVSPPASGSSPGNLGDFSGDGAYIYVCISANTWIRASASAF